MISLSLRQSSRHLSRSARLFSTSAKAMAEGDTGGSRPQQQSDAWSNREKANEDMYVRQQERKKLEDLQKKLAQQRQDIASLEKDIAAIAEEHDKKEDKK